MHKKIIFLLFIFVQISHAMEIQVNAEDKDPWKLSSELLAEFPTLQHQTQFGGRALLSPHVSAEHFNSMISLAKLTKGIKKNLKKKPLEKVVELAIVADMVDVPKVFKKAIAVIAYGLATNKQKDHFARFGTYSVNIPEQLSHLVAEKFIEIEPYLLNVLLKHRIPTLTVPPAYPTKTLPKEVDPKEFESSEWRLIDRDGILHWANHKYNDTPVFDYVLPCSHMRLGKLLNFYRNPDFPQELLTTHSNTGASDVLLYFWRLPSVQPVSRFIMSINREIKMLAWRKNHTAACIGNHTNENPFNSHVLSIFTLARTSSYDYKPFADNETDFVTALKFDESGTELVCGSRNGRVALLVEQEDGEHFESKLVLPKAGAPYGGHSSEVTEICSNPGIKRMFASGSKAGDISVWDTQKGFLIKLLGHKKAIDSISFSEDGQLLASSSKDQTIRLWSPYLSGCLRVMNAQLGRITFADSDTMLQIYDQETMDRQWMMIKDADAQQMLKGMPLELLGFLSYAGKCMLEGKKIDIHANKELYELYYKLPPKQRKLINESIAWSLRDWLPI